MGAFATIWVFTDILAKGKNLYTLLASVVFAQTLLVFSQILITAIKGSNNLILSEESAVLVFAYL
jgi:hypothetical protein